MKLDKILESRNIGYDSPNWGRTPPGYYDDDPREFRDDDEIKDAVEEFIEDEIFNHEAFTTPLDVLEKRGDKWDYDKSPMMRKLYKAIDSDSGLKAYFDGMNALEEVLMFSKDAKEFDQAFNTNKRKALMKFAFVNDMDFLKKHPDVYRKISEIVQDSVASGDFEPKVLQQDDDY